MGVHLGWGVLFKAVVEQDPAHLVFGTVQVLLLDVLLAPLPAGTRGEVQPEWASAGTIGR